MVKAIGRFVRKVIQQQSRLISWNPIIGGAYLLASSLVLIFWLPVQLYNLVRFPLDAAVFSMFVLQCANVFAVMRRSRFQ